MNQDMSRRSALRKVTGTTVALAATSLATRLKAADEAASPTLKGHINHSVCRWCYGKISLEDLCNASKAMGIQSIDLMEVQDFPTLKKHGLICAMVSGVPGGIGSGLNRVENHDKIVEFFEKTAPIVAEYGYPNIICFSGNRKGMSDEQGLENCAIGLKRVAPIAEKHKVTVVMELLNSKRDHHDYMCDHTAWGVRVIREVNSPKVKLLYDIYHMQIMEGDLSQTIIANSQWFGHFHTGGVPGRHELDDSQEVNWAGVMRAIASTDFQGFVGHEFIPTRDPMTSLRQAVALCNV